ncbi:L-amino-acid oxidase [Halenospora varia]|nr:L-amino-acid oxidase [Halenospora varia]
MSFLLLSARDPIPRSSVIFNGPFSVQQGGIQNINVVYEHALHGGLTVAYGSCDSATLDDIHHRVGYTHIGDHPFAKRHFVWIVPADIVEGCLHAFVGDQLVGRSEQFSVSKRVIKRSATFAKVADTMGPWFDGVEYLKQKEPSAVFVSSVKSKKFGILGAGISGLHTALILDSVGIHNWKILESDNRLGGRIRTTYLNGTTPDEYQYHELGPMRFPTTITDADTNETLPIMDQQLLLQLADVLNEMNVNDSSLAVKFIPWIQSSDNAPVATSKRRPDGTIPGKKEIAANSSLADVVTYSNTTAANIAIDALAAVKALDKDRIRFYAKNVFRAHKQAVEEGLFDFSEVEYLRHVIGTDLNTTDEVTSTAVSWPIEWTTIDKGLSRLPEAFAPLVKGRIMFNTKVHGVKYNKENNSVTVAYRPTGGDPAKASRLEQFDHIFNSVPFNLLRFWELPPHSSLMRRSIDHLVFDGAVKIAIQYKERFWEHLEHPIIGGCGRVNIPRIGQICYPSYGINNTGPGVMIAAYISSTDARVACAMPEGEHIAYVQRAMVELHGPIADEMWTGNYERHCWEHDEHHAGSWAVPIVPQQQLYLPTYWQTEFNTVFIGEHTAYTHSWIFSVLESSTRGTAQMLLDLGLVDGAKQVTRTWMARWINL